MRFKFFRAWVGTVATTAMAIAATAAGSVAQAQPAYPNKPIRLVVPYGPGGPSDVVARVLADEIGRNLGQSMVVDNRPGAGSSLGTDLVVRSPADGYTLLLADLPMTIVPHVLRATIKYQPLRDLEPIALIGTSSMGFYASPGLPAHTLADFVALAKSRAAPVQLGSGGIGTLTHLMAEVFAQSAGFAMTHVPYQGTGPAMTDLLGSRIDAMFNSYLATAPYLDKLRPLGVATGSRSPEMPNVPTFAEAGFPTVSVSYWLGIVAPARMPKPVSDVLRQAIEKAVQSRAVKERFQSLAITAAPDFSAEAMRRTMETDYARWGAVVRERNISAN